MALEGPVVPPSAARQWAAQARLGGPQSDSASPTTLCPARQAGPGPPSPPPQPQAHAHWCCWAGALMTSFPSPGESRAPHPKLTDRCAACSRHSPSLEPASERTEHLRPAAGRERGSAGPALPSAPRYSPSGASGVGGCVTSWWDIRLHGLNGKPRAQPDSFMSLLKPGFNHIP